MLREADRNAKGVTWPRWPLDDRLIAKAEEGPVNYAGYASDRWPRASQMLDSWSSVDRRGSLPAVASGRDDARLPTPGGRGERASDPVPLPAPRVRVVAPRRRDGRRRRERASRPLESIADALCLRSGDPWPSAGARAYDRCCAQVERDDSDMILTRDRSTSAVRVASSQVAGTRGGSSVGQSSGLIIRRSQVQVLPAPRSFSQVSRYVAIVTTSP
jgi:hypothetical protein